MSFGILGVYTLHTMCEPVSAVTSCRCALHTDLSFKGEVMYVSLVMVLSQTTKINSRH